VLLRAGAPGDSAAGHGCLRPGHLRGESAGLVGVLDGGARGPVHRCAEPIEPLTGARPSAGFVHGMLARAAAVAGANRLIRALITLAQVVCADETPIRAGPGPKARKRYLPVACTRLLTCYFLGDRSLDTFAAFVFPDLSGAVVVHDRYQNYDKFTGLVHQLCAQHLLRDLADAAETYPDAHWPIQITQAL
jgi:transposase